MQNPFNKRLGQLSLLICVAFVAYGCAQQGYSVVAMTGTVIGVDIAQNPATQTPHAKLGYNRSELAFVPTNRHKNAQGGSGGQSGQSGGGAMDSANVLMELRYGGIFDTGPSSGIYQRLAVGNIAVTQAGASAMFLKDADGKVDENAERAMRAIRGIAVPSPSVEGEKAPLSARFFALEKQNDVAALREFDAAARELGYPKSSVAYKNYPAFRDFAVSPNTTIEEVRTIRKRLESKNITFVNS